MVDLARDGTIEMIREKPEYDFLVNTGIYLAEPCVIDCLGDGEHMDMPDVARRLMERGFRVGGTPLRRRAGWIWASSVR